MELGVRIALHTADAQLRNEGNYFGVALSRCARIRTLARGGQTLLSHATHDLVADRLPDGVELIDYLRQQNGYSDPASSPRPGLILLDLNMPRMDGREALRRIKSDPTLHDIPVVILSTSGLDEDIVRSYQLGVNSFITKPVTFSGLVAAMNILGRYWLEIVELPPVAAHIASMV